MDFMYFRLGGTGKSILEGAELNEATRCARMMFVILVKKPKFFQSFSFTTMVIHLKGAVPPTHIPHRKPGHQFTNQWLEEFFARSSARKVLFVWTNDFRACIKPGKKQAVRKFLNPGCREVAFVGKIPVGALKVGFEQHYAFFIKKCPE